ncbi:MAG: DeoR family transcriptional regulator, partial [Gammaproteobacteria bacterium]
MAKRQSKELVRDKLLPAQRQNFILDVLYEQRAATLFQLSERIGASFSTVRRDLDEMAEKGLLKRTHGGAMLINSRAGHAEPDDLSN